MKLIKIIFMLFSLCIVLDSCKNEQPKVLKFNSSDLEGEWFSQNISDGIHTKVLFFSFEDNHCSYFFPELRGGYYVKGDKLVIKPISQVDPDFQFSILNLDSTSMALIPSKLSKRIEDKIFCYSEDMLEELGVTNPSILDTIFLKKIKQKNNINLDRILFRSGVHENGLPSYLEVNQSGEVFYYGALDDFYGGFIGSISKIEYSNLNRKINSLDLSKLKKNYPSSKSDSKAFDILIEYDKKAIYVTAHNSDYEPVELRALIQYFQDMVKDIDLIKSSDISPNNFKEFGAPLIELVP